MYQSLRALAKDGARVTIGPAVAERDGAMRAVASHDTRGLEVEPLGDRARADALVARFIEERDVPTYTVDPGSAYVTVHEDEEGAARVVFVMNPTDEPIEAHVGLPDTVRELTLAWPARTEEETHVSRKVGGFEVYVGAREVRMLEVR